MYFAADTQEKEFVQVPQDLKSQILFLHNFKKKYDFRENCLVIMSPNHKLAILFGIFSNYKIILDAGWPLSDSSRNLRQISGVLGHLRNLLVDYFSFKLSDKIVFETYAQLDSSAIKFRIKREKISYVYTGFNEKNLLAMSTISTKPRELHKVNAEIARIILFRGKKNLESGLDLIVESAKQSKNDALFVICTNRKIVGTSPNTIVINRYVPDSELKWLYENSICVIGQISGHQRMKKTIPHKFFESAYFAKCYITPLHNGLSELVDENAVIDVTSISTKGLNDAITKALSNAQIRNNCENKLSEIYTNRISQHQLAEKFRTIINDVE